MQTLMRPIHLCSLTGLMLCICLHGAELQTAPFLASPGLVVEELGQDTVLEKAGIRVGDILRSWEREPSPPANPSRAAGHLDSFFDWSWLLEDQVPRGSIGLRVDRAGELLDIMIPPGSWRAVVRPVLDSSTLAEYHYLREQAKGGTFDVVQFREYLANAGRALEPETRCWLEILAGNFAAKAKNPSEARALYQNGLVDTTDPIARVYLLQSIGITYQDAGDFGHAEDFYRQALSVSEAAWGDSLMKVTSLKAIYLLAWRKRDMQTVKEYTARVASLLERYAPESLLYAHTLNIIGNVASREGDFATARTSHERALKIRRLREPGGIDVAQSLINLGNIAFQQEDFATANVLYGEAQSILEVKGQGSAELTALYANYGKIRTALGDYESAETLLLKAAVLDRRSSLDTRVELNSTLNSLSLLAQRRGDLTSAEEWSQQVVRELRRTAPQSAELADALRALGGLRFRLGDFERAEDYFQEALALSEAENNQFDAAVAVAALARIAHTQGKYQKAEKLYKAALSIQEKSNPRSSQVATILHNLGDLQVDRKAPQKALALFRRALAIQEGISPHNPDVAVSMKQIGNVLRQLGKPKEALESHRRALAIMEETAPGTSPEADILYELSQDLSMLGRPEEALSSLRRCIGILDSQVARINIEENRTLFRNRFASYYRELVHSLHKMGHDREAFETLEAYRAQSFLTLLSERDIAFSEVPSELEAERRRLAADYDAVQKNLLAPAVDSGERLSMARRLRDIHERQTALFTEILVTSPKVATLRHPEPLDLTGTQRNLDRGTALVSFSIGRKETLAFVLLPQGDLRVYQIPAGQERLTLEVTQFRAVLESTSSKSPRMTTFLAAGRHLYQLLLGPADSMLQQSERILIVPDGPLHILPFSALIRHASAPIREDEHQSFLAEWKPLHLAVSAAVYFELKNSRRLPPDIRAASWNFVGFGDPLYPAELRDADSGKDPQIRRAAQIFRFDELPGTRQEILRVADLFGDLASTYFQQDATETKAKSVGKEIRYLHFATHGILDEQFPLNSSLALTPSKESESGHENGLLQAWEIFEQVRLDADLVVLSACESGLGKEMGGEGLIGLTRAFQYAGARSVMASLWKISDRTTAELMVRFYKHLKNGLPKDEALRAAQMELIHGPIQVKNEKGEVEEIDASAPYYWAAFQIYGDWQ